MVLFKLLNYFPQIVSPYDQIAVNTPNAFFLQVCIHHTYMAFQKFDEEPDCTYLPVVFTAYHTSPIIAIDNFFWIPLLSLDRKADIHHGELASCGRCHCHVVLVHFRSPEERPP